MSSYNYVDATNVNLLCCICRTPFFEPVTTRTCAHTFCRICISTALSLSLHCPIDRSPLTSDDLLPADPLLRNLVDELEVECPHRSAGCSVISQRQLIESHLANSCPFTEVSCADGQCEALVPRKDAKHSDHTSAISGSERGEVKDPDVETILVRCDACDSEYSPSDLAFHREECEDVVVECAQAANGCTWNGRRRDLSLIHLLSCPYEAIKGFFTVHDHKVSVLTKENEVLRHKVTAMEGMLTSLQRELANVKAILGPWYRSDGGTVRRRVSEPPQNATRPGQGHRPQSASTSQTAPISRTLPPLSSVTIVDPTDLSSYFPPPEEDSSSSVYTQHNSFNGADTTPVYHSAVSAGAIQQPAVQGPSTRPPIPVHSSYFQQPLAQAVQPGPSASPPQSPIAPLDISTTLEGSLAGLRESIVTVSAALDSLSRRQEVALTTESMRTTEEIRSLRAVIHGLRMQVHSIMMDRNAQATGRPGEEFIPPVWIPDMREGLAPLPWLHAPYNPRYPHGAMPSSVASIPKL